MFNATGLAVIQPRVAFAYTNQASKKKIIPLPSQPDKSDTLKLRLLTELKNSDEKLSKKLLRELLGHCKPTALFHQMCYLAGRKLNEYFLQNL